jgi:hypothetical protein
MERPVEEIVKEIFEMAKDQYSNAIEGLPELKWESIPEPVRHRIEEHSKLTAFQLTAILVILCPGLIVTPALSTLGFSGIGPVAGMFILIVPHEERLIATQEALLQRFNRPTE